jgi:Tfp pilus assembly protein PilN
MIRINLLQPDEQNPGNLNGGGLGIAGAAGWWGNLTKQLAALNVQAGTLNLEQLKQIATPTFLAFGIWFLADKWEDRQLAAVNAVIDELTVKITELKDKELKLKELEPVQKAFEEDQLNFERKITTIKKLLSIRSEMIKILVSIPLHLPTDTWLKSFSIDPKVLKMSGNTIGFTAVSDFMRDLKSDALFSDVQLIKSERSSELKDATNREFSTFELEIKRTIQ